MRKCIDRNNHFERHTRKSKRIGRDKKEVIKKVEEQTKRKKNTEQQAKAQANFLIALSPKPFRC